MPEILPGCDIIIPHSDRRIAIVRADRSKLGQPLKVARFNSGTLKKFIDMVGEYAKDTVQDWKEIEIAIVDTSNAAFEGGWLFARPMNSTTVNGEPALANDMWFVMAGIDYQKEVD